MKNILVCWLGETDLQALKGSDDSGPIERTMRGLRLDEVHILSDLGSDNNSHYRNWLSGRTSGKIEIHSIDFCGPATVENIHRATVEVVDKIRELSQDDTLLIFHQNSGEPIMGKVLADLAKTRYSPSALIEVSMEQGNNRVNLNLKWSGFEILPSIVGQANFELLFPDLPSMPLKIRRSIIRARP